MPAPSPHRLPADACATSTPSTTEIAPHIQPSRRRCSTHRALGTRGICQDSAAASGEGVERRCLVGCRVVPFRFVSERSGSVDLKANELQFVSISGQLIPFRLSTLSFYGLLRRICNRALQMARLVSTQGSYPIYSLQNEED